MFSQFPRDRGIDRTPLEPIMQQLDGFLMAYTPTLSKDEAEFMLPYLLGAGAFHIALPLMEQFRLGLTRATQSSIRAFLVRSDVDCSTAAKFIPFGFDLVASPGLRLHERTLLEEARDHVGANPLELVPAVSLAAVSTPTAPTSLNLIQSALTCQSCGSLEEQREHLKEMNDRHFRALFAGWKEHSIAVRSHLLTAAPGELLPPLVNIVAGYLDLD